MKVSVDDVKSKFHELMDGRITREEADRWAYSIVKKTETGEVGFVPERKKQLIWDCIMYLYGIDLQEKPNEYLYSTEDIKNMFKDFFPEEMA